VDDGRAGRRVDGQKPILVFLRLVLVLNEKENRFALAQHCGMAWPAALLSGLQHHRQNAHDGGGKDGRDRRGYDHNPVADKGVCEGHRTRATGYVQYAYIL
jgi:hypothetical protein